MDLKKEIILRLKKVVKDLSGQEVAPHLEYPADEEHGDYASNIALTMFANSKLKTQNSKPRSPIELAEKIADEFRIQNSGLIIIEKVEAVKPGFVNFWLSKKILVDNLQEIINSSSAFSKSQDLSKKVVVEYSSPNIAKPFSVGHLRSTIIGDAIANLLEANGWKVYRDNHLGDWGTQFGKQIYAIKTWGNEQKIEESQNPIKELVNLYVKFHEEAEKNPEFEEKAREWFKKLEEGDLEARRLWKKCMDWSLKEFQLIYEKLGVKFTENNGVGYGESFFEDKMKGVLEELDKKKLLKESEGAKLVFFENDPMASSGQGKFPPLMIVKKDGATLYATRDLAADKFRLKEHGKDVVIINEVGIEQSLYFKQLFEIEKMLGWVKEGQRIHIKHGHYRFKDAKMSTRKGNTIWLEEVLQEAVKRAEKLGSKGQDMAESVGIGALKWNDLKRSSNLDIVFDWDEILNMEGNSGPYLQYTFARTQSVLAKTKVLSMKYKILSMKLEAEETSLLRALQRFPETLEEAGGRFAPNILCNYLFDLAQKFNLFYQKHKILNPAGLKRDSSSVSRRTQNDRIQEFRLMLTQGVGKIIKRGLNILGIKALERM